MSRKYVRVKTLLNCLKEACEKEGISENDWIIMAEILDNNVSIGHEELPEGTLKLTTSSDDPAVDIDHEIYIFLQDKKEETE